jgi:hypothetical protein
MFRRSALALSAVLAGAATLLATGGTVSAQTASNAKPQGMFTTIGGVTPYPTSKTVAHWNSSFSYQGTTYPYTMMGTNPLTTSSRTLTPTEIIPINLEFANGARYNGADIVSDWSIPQYSRRLISPSPVTPPSTATRSSGRSSI